MSVMGITPGTTLSDESEGPKSADSESIQREAILGGPYITAAFKGIRDLKREIIFSSGFKEANKSAMRVYMVRTRKWPLRAGSQPWPTASKNMGPSHL